MKKLLRSVIMCAFIATLVFGTLMTASAEAKVAKAGTNEAVCAGGHADGNWVDLEGTKITVSSETNGGGQTEGINFGWAWDKEYLNDAAINAGKYDGQYKVIDRTAFSPTGALVGAGWWLRIGYHSGVEDLESVDAKQEMPVEITVELPQKKSIGQVNLWPRAYLDSDDGKTTVRPERIFFPQAFEILTSLDGRTWNKVYSKDYGKELYVPEVGKWLAGRNVGKDNIARPTLHSYTFANVDAKFVKIRVTRKAVDTQPNKAGKYDSAVCLSEIELYTGTGSKPSDSSSRSTSSVKPVSSGKGASEVSSSATSSSASAIESSIGEVSETSEITSSEQTVSEVLSSEETNSDSNVSGDGDKNNIGLIIGIIAAVVIVLAGGGFALYWFKFRIAQ